MLKTLLKQLCQEAAGSLSSSFPESKYQSGLTILQFKSSLPFSFPNLYCHQICPDTGDSTSYLKVIICKSFIMVHVTQWKIVIIIEGESEVAQSCPTHCDLWTVAHQAPPSMGFSRQEYWSGLPFPQNKNVNKILSVHFILILTKLVLSAQSHGILKIWENQLLLSMRKSLWLWLKYMHTCPGPHSCTPPTEPPQWKGQATTREVGKEKLPRISFGVGALDRVP